MNLDATIKRTGTTEELIERRKLPHERAPWLSTLEAIRSLNEEPRRSWHKRLSEMTVRDALTHPWAFPIILLSSLVAMVVGVLV